LRVALVIAEDKSHDRQPRHLRCSHSGIGKHTGVMNTSPYAAICYRTHVCDTDGCWVTAGHHATHCATQCRDARKVLIPDTQASPHQAQEQIFSPERCPPKLLAPPAACVGSHAPTVRRQTGKRPVCRRCLLRLPRQRRCPRPLPPHRQRPWLFRLLRPFWFPPASDVALFSGCLAAEALWPR
jgi:hypothetical protein